MKYTVMTIVIFFIALAAYTRFIGPLPLTVTSTVTQKTDTFSVTGEGTVEVTPDIAIISVGVQSTGATVKQTQDTLNTAINAVSESIKKIGIESGDIKTTNYSITPQYDYRPGQTQRITGYTASTNLTVKVRDLTRANAVLDAATVSGANTIGGITFDIDDKTKAWDQARKLAVTDAKKKAEIAAKTAGFGLGRIINYSENNQDSPRPMLQYAGGNMAKDAAAPTAVEPGANQITVAVTISYELR